MRKKSLTTLCSILAIALTLSWVGATPLAAQSPTPKPSASPKITSSPAPSATSSAVALHETTEKLRERLQKILGDQDENTDGKATKAAYIGEVTRISDEAITLKTLVGSEIIPLESSTILLKRTQRIPVADITVGNWVIVIGSREKNKAVRPELLMVQTGDLKPREHLATIGVVTDTAASSITLIPRGKTDPLTFAVTKNSKILDAGGEAITLKALPKDVSVVVVGYATDKGWELGSLKTSMSMAEFKSPATPTPTPAPRRATPKPSPAVSPVPTP